MLLSKLNARRYLLDAKKGFTLIEILVVISIIALLVAAASTSYLNANQKSRDGRRKTDLKGIQQALELYFQSNGQYPPAQVGWCTQISSTQATQVHDALQPTFISKLPQDPSFANTTSDYFYVKVSNSQYQLYSTLENTKDPDYIADALGTDSHMGCLGATNTYHYKVINP